MLPDFHKEDKPDIVTYLLDHLMENVPSYTSSNLSKYMEFLLIKSKTPRSGMGVSLPYDTYGVDICAVIPHVSLKLLCVLIDNGADVDETVLIYSIKHSKETAFIEQFRYMVTKFTEADYIDSEEKGVVLASLVHLALKHGKTIFAEVIKKCAKMDGVDASAFLGNDASQPKAIENEKLSVSTRTEYLMNSLVKCDLAASESLLDSGPINPENINICKIVTLPQLSKITSLFPRLFDEGVSPHGPSDASTPPIVLLLQSKCVSRLCLAKLAEVLFNYGVSVAHISLPYKDDLSPVHAATKLALDTGETRG